MRHGAKSIEHLALRGMPDIDRVRSLVPLQSSSSKSTPIGESTADSEATNVAVDCGRSWNMARRIADVSSCN